MSGEFWPIFFLAIVLKIPIVALCALVWWAVRATPDPEHTGGDDPPERRFGPHPRPRGPHGPLPAALPSCPPGRRTRSRPALAPDPACSSASAQAARRA
jgi:hypothetical protein